MSDPAATRLADLDAQVYVLEQQLLVLARYIGDRPCLEDQRCRYMSVIRHMCVPCQARMIMRPSDPGWDLRRERDELLAYIAFLNAANEEPIRLAAAHGWHCPESVVQEGRERRARIPSLAS